MDLRCKYIASALVLFVGLNCIPKENAILIHTSFGPIQGEQFLSIWTNQTIYSFKGIPYAKSPVEDLRFKDSIPPDSWSEVKDCTKERPICPQSSTEPALMSEDCLFLNVYTPQVSPEFEPLPVVVWLHGGAFIEGSGNYDLFGPDLIVGEGVVVVTLNYRLGALGFLSMGVPDAPGNVGLKDQRLALQWVNSEIPNFGGDPRQVTLFGESAGAIAIHLHNFSPDSVGLFHRAIGNSGSPLAYRVREDGRPFARQLAKLLDCETEDTTEVLACLRAANYQDIIRAQALIKSPYQDDTTGLASFVPTIDRDIGTIKPLLPDLPFNLMEQKNKSVQFLMGFNSGEGIVRLKRKEVEIKNITNNLEYLYALQVPGDNICLPKMKAEKIKQFYFEDSSSNAFIKGFTRVYSDVLYDYGSVIIARNYQKTENVFLYYFSFEGRFESDNIKRIKEKYNISGVCHGEELNYLFIVKAINQTLTDNSADSITFRRMVKMWTNFIKYGTPTVGPDPLLQNVQWQPASGGKTNHLHIGVDLRMISEDLIVSRAALWDSITFNYCR